MDKLKTEKYCSCPRHKIRTRTDRQNSTFRYLYYVHTYQQHRRSYSKTALTFEDWKAVVIRPCFYCEELDTRSHHTAPSFRKLYKHLTPQQINEYTVKANGIDRLNPHNNYTKSNSVSCCKRCNAMKSNMPFSVFIRLCGKIYLKHKHAIA